MSDVFFASEKDRAAFEQLAEVVSSGEAIAFVGAGDTTEADHSAAVDDEDVEREPALESDAPTDAGEGLETAGAPPDVASLAPVPRDGGSVEAQAAGAASAAQAHDASPPPAAPDADDPQKGRWGGLSERNGRRLSAKVTASKGDAEWFKVFLLLESTDTKRPLRGRVIFHLHDTFANQEEEVGVSSHGRATLTLWCYGAFTVGAEADGGRTRLELDLATLEDAPRLFRER